MNILPDCAHVGRREWMVVRNVQRLRIEAGSPKPSIARSAVFDGHASAVLLISLVRILAAVLARTPAGRSPLLARIQAQRRMSTTRHTSRPATARILPLHGWQRVTVRRMHGLHRPVCRL